MAYAGCCRKNVEANERSLAHTVRLKERNFVSSYFATKKASALRLFWVDFEIDARYSTSPPPNKIWWKRVLICGEERHVNPEFHVTSLIFTPFQCAFREALLVNYWWKYHFALPAERNRPMIAFSFQNCSHFKTFNPYQIHIGTGALQQVALLRSSSNCLATRVHYFGLCTFSE